MSYLLNGSLKTFLSSFISHTFKSEYKGLNVAFPLQSQSAGFYFGEKRWWFGPGAEGAFCPGHRCWMSWLLVLHGLSETPNINVSCN